MTEADDDQERKGAAHNVPIFLSATGFAPAHPHRALSRGPNAPLRSRGLAHARSAQMPDGDGGRRGEAPDQT